MNIIFASVDALPRLGGVSVMAHHLAESTARLGGTVVFVGPRGAYVPPGFDRHYLFYEDVDSNLAHRAGSLAPAEDARIEALFGALIRNYSIDRVVLVHPFYYGPGALAASRRAGIPATVFFHGFEIRSQIVAHGFPGRSPSPGDVPAPTALHERTYATIAQASELAANSRYTRDLLAGFDAAGSIEVVGCGVDLPAARRIMQRDPGNRAAKASVRGTLGLPDRPTLAFLGRLVPSKKVDRLLRIVRHLPEMQLLVIGAGPERKALEAQAAAAGIRDRILFAGALDEEAKWTHLLASDFVCLLSEPDDRNGAVEGFGIALLEGALAGALPVTSGCGGMADVVEHEVNGIVLDRIDATAATQVAAAWRDEAAMARLVGAARAQIIDRYNWDVIARRNLARWSAPSDEGQPPPLS